MEVKLLQSLKPAGRANTAERGSGWPSRVSREALGVPFALALDARERLFPSGEKREAVPLSADHSDARPTAEKPFLSASTTVERKVEAWSSQGCVTANAR